MATQLPADDEYSAPALPKRSRASPSSAASHDDDIPPPPKRRSPVLGFDAGINSEIPAGSPLPVSVDPGIVYNEMMCVAISPLAGPSSTVPGPSSPISLDGDNESDDFACGEPEEHDTEWNSLLFAEGKEKQEMNRVTKEEKARLNEEKKWQREGNKVLKEASKAQKAEQKKYAKENEDWVSEKYDLKYLVAEIDQTIILRSSFAGALLARFAENDLQYRIMLNNPMRGSILWKKEVPQIGQDPASVSEVPYILFVLQDEELCDLIRSGSFMDHVLKVQSRYPTYTICYVTDKLMNDIINREQSQYRNPSSSNSWERPPVEEVLCNLATHYVGVHSRQCTDEGEVAEHVVSFTSSLANCKYRKPLTWLPVHANSVMIPKNFIDRDLAKNDTWMKSLIAILEVHPRYALAIYKKYPTMRSLLNVYMDPSKTDREKELLLKDLKCEDLVGDESRRVGPIFSRRVYKYLTAEEEAAEADSAE